jgi:hypothetical protein
MTTTTQTAPQTGETCLCREVLRRVDEVFGLKSEAARQHLRNSRIEFLKAIRSLIDERIEHLSRVEQPGTKVTVE